MDFACTLVNTMGREGAFDCNGKRRDDAAGWEAAPDMEGRKGARGTGAVCRRLESAVNDKIGAQWSPSRYRGIQKGCRTGVKSQQS